MTLVFPLAEARDIVKRALDEDLGRGGDLTTRTLVPRRASACAFVVARETLVAAGLPLIDLVMRDMASREGGPVVTTVAAAEGARLTAGAVLAQLEGDAWSLLGGERVLLNLLSRVSGVASFTARCVAEVAGTGCTIADTRKTTPGLRALEKYAVAVGGGENHRPTLDAMLLAKDNHKLLAGGIAAVLDRLREAGVNLQDIEVEVDDLAEFDLVLAAGVGWILLDNFGVDAVREAARRAGGRARLEVSGGLRPGALRPFAEAGARRLSLGVLTHGAPAVDIALDVRAESGERP